MIIASEPLKRGVFFSYMERGIAKTAEALAIDIISCGHGH